MNSTEILLIAIGGILVQFFLIMFAVRIGNDVKERNKQLIIQNNLLHLLCEKMGVAADKINEAYK